MLPQRAEIAPKQADTLVRGCLQMRRFDRQYVVIPFTGRETLPGVRRILGRVWAPVHPNDALLRLPLRVLVPGDHLLRCRIDLGPDPDCTDVGEIVRWKRVALLLGKSIDGCIPALRAHSAGRAERNALIFTQIGAGPTPGLILLNPNSPESAQIHLGERWNHGEYRS